MVNYSVPFSYWVKPRCKCDQTLEASAIILQTMDFTLTHHHFFNPKNVGYIADANAAVASTGSLRCGATVTVSLSIDDDSRKITNAKFQSAGCSFLVAANSFLTEQVKGKTTAEAAVLGLSPLESIIEPLGNWPVDRYDCAALACEALIAAVEQYSDSVREQWEGEEALICTCFGVSERTIENAIRRSDLRSIPEVTKACNAGGGCRSCYPLIEDILGSVRGEW